MKPPIIWFVLVVAGLAGCGHQVRLDYTRTEQLRAKANEASHEGASHKRLKLEVAADLDREPPKASDATVATAEELSTKQPGLAVTNFLGGVHYHGDIVIEAARRREPVRQRTKMTNQRDERCEHLRREHEERVAEWLSRFD